MKRLFEVNGEFFDNKVAAKVARGPVTTPGTTADPLVFSTWCAPLKYKYTVKPGPDHFRRS